MMDLAGGRSDSQLRKIRGNLYAPASILLSRLKTATGKKISSWPTCLDVLLSEKQKRAKPSSRHRRAKRLIYLVAIRPNTRHAGRCPAHCEKHWGEPDSRHVGPPLHQPLGYFEIRLDSQQPSGIPTHHPAVLMNQFGKGKVIYATG